jgi:hypothetical protein
MNASDTSRRTDRPASGRGYLNAVLTANAMLLGVVALNGLGLTGGFTSVSHAQTNTSDEGLISAAEQRKQMITELRSMTQRLDKIDATLAKGVNVNVKNFPTSFGTTGEASKGESRTAPEIKKVERPAPRTGNVAPR